MKKILTLLIVPIIFLAFTGMVEAIEPAEYQQLAMSKKSSANNNPCAMKNPCSSSKTLKHGERLWKDVSLGNSGMSCASCHPNGQGLYNTPYPRYIKMADKVISLKGMINFCMETPMKAEALDVDGAEMAGLVAYINANSSAQNPCATNNPCGAMNPCAVKNPCANNPCATMNPCAVKNPCGGM